MRFSLSAILALLLVSCRGEVREQSLAGLDLNDPQIIDTLKGKLAPEQQTALATYALLHWPESKFYCGKAIDPSLKSPETVGEAIDQTLAYEARRTAQVAASRRETSPLDEALEEQAQLIARIDSLALRRDILNSRLGPASPTSEEYKTIERDMAATRQTLAKVRDQIRQRAIDASAVQSITG